MGGGTPESYRAERGAGDSSGAARWCRSPAPLPLRLRPPALVAVLLFASGCLTAHPRTGPAPPAPEFRPEVFFEGRTRGIGTLDVRGGAPELIRVESYGRAAPDGAFRLDQTITRADGSTSTRTWTMRRTDATRYAATLTDAEGEVSAEVRGSELLIRYRMGWPSVVMHQRLVLQPGGQTALNLATVRVLGVPWARLNEQIHRVDGVPPDSLAAGAP